MHGIKATMIFSLTALILMASFMIYNNHQERFVLLPMTSEKSIYIFDRKHTKLNYCTPDNQCTLIPLKFGEETESHESILPSMLLHFIGGKPRTAAEEIALQSTVTVSATHTETSTKQADQTSAPAATSSIPAETMTITMTAPA